MLLILEIKKGNTNTKLAQRVHEFEGKVDEKNKSCECESWI